MTKNSKILQMAHERLHDMGYQPLSRYKVESFIIDYYEIWINNKTNHTINIEVSKNKGLQMYSEITDFHELK